MLEPLTVAVAQPACEPGDVGENISRHAAVIRSTPSRLVVFPELSLTGYDLDASALEVGGPELRPLVEACAATGSTALVGAPVRCDDTEHIAQLAATGAGATVAYCKTHLGGYEHERFVPGPGPAALTVAGWRVGLGICKDTRIDEHLGGTLALGIDLYVAGLVHAPDEADDLAARARRIGELGSVPVAFASAAGNAGPTHPATAGRSAIWAPTGEVIAAAGAEPGAVVVATLSSGDDRRP